MPAFSPPTAQQAEHFALILHSGVPPATAIRYFFPEHTEDAAMAQRLAAAWQAHTLVQEALERLQGGRWTHLSLEDRLKLVIEKAYAEMAYYLYAHNLAELEGTKLTKAQDFRKAIEAKLAGLTGAQDALSRFYEDVLKGRVALNRVPETEGKPH